MRPDWDTYFMNLARAAATRGTCDRKLVGCVLVLDRILLATGYNGAIRGLGHCDDVGHLMEDGHCIRTVHAEMNAVAQAARRGIPINGATCYCTASPCFPCFKVLANAGVREVVFDEFYRDQRVQDFAQQAGIIWRELGKNSV